MYISQIKPRFISVKNKIGKIKDIANMIRDKSSEFYDWERKSNKVARPTLCFQFYTG